MSRTTKTISFSVTPSFAQRIDRLRKREGRTTSELIREAVRFYEELYYKKQTRRPKYFGKDFQLERLQFEGPKDMSKRIDEIVYGN